MPELRWADPRKNCEQWMVAPEECIVVRDFDAQAGNLEVVGIRAARPTSPSRVVFAEFDKNRENPVFSSAYQQREVPVLSRPKRPAEKPTARMAYKLAILAVAPTK
jgi:hypothetical protein